MKAQYSSLYWIIIVILLGLSLYFTIQIVSFQSGLKAGSESLEMKSGAVADFSMAIDGDEVVLKLNDNNITVRILGIKAFDPTANDPFIRDIAGRAVAYLQTRLKGNAVMLEFAEFKLDAHRRVLAYLKQEETDIGLEMVKKGMVIVYTLYPFDRMQAYLDAEKEARQSGKGLWSNPTAFERAEKLKRIWEQEN